MQLLALALYILTRLVLFLEDNEPARESVPSNAKLRHRKLNKRTEKDLFHKSNCNYNFEKPIQWFALENQQSPFYVINEVTLTGQNPSLKFC